MSKLFRLATNINTSRDTAEDHKLTNNAVSYDGEITTYNGTTSYSRVNNFSYAFEDFYVRIIFKTTQASNTGVYRGFVSKGTAGYQDFVLFLGTSSVGTNKLGFYMRDEDGNYYSNVYTTTDINDGEWHEAIVTRQYSTGYVRLYLDGVLEASFTFNAGKKINNTEDYFDIARYSSGASSQYCKMDLKLLEIGDEYLSATTVSQLYNKTKKKNIQARRTGNYFKAFKSKDNENYIDFPSSIDKDSWTIAFTAKDWEYSYTILLSEDSLDAIYADQTSGLLRYRDTSATYYTLGSGYNIYNGINKIVITSNGTGIYIYVNGVYKGGITPTTTKLRMSGLFRYGVYYDFTPDAYFWDVRFWGYHISEKEILKYGTGVKMVTPAYWWKLDEGSGTVAYDSAGTLNGTYVGTDYHSTVHDTDYYVKENFSKVNESNTTPEFEGWNINSGTFKVYNGGGLEGDSKYIRCVTDGSLSLEDNSAYGTWEFDVYKGGNYNVIDLYFVSDTKETTQNGYRVFIDSSERVKTAVASGGTSTTQGVSVAGYVSNWVWYRLKITRDLSGTTTTYIKGGSFGTTSWTLIPGGNNPYTSTTTTNNTWLVISLDTDDQITNIKHYRGVD